MTTKIEDLVEKEEERKNVRILAVSLTKLEYNFTLGRFVTHKIPFLLFGKQTKNEEWWVSKH